jgi:hypothetical protein
LRVFFMQDEVIPFFVRNSLKHPAFQALFNLEGKNVVNPAAAKGAGDSPAEPPGIYATIDAVTGGVNGRRANTQLVNPVAARLPAAGGNLPAVWFVIQSLHECQIKRATLLDYRPDSTTL